MDGPDDSDDGVPNLGGVDHLDLDGVADALGITPDAARDLIRSGDLPGTWIPEQSTWYVRRRDLDDYQQR